MPLTFFSPLPSQPPFLSLSLSLPPSPSPPPPTTLNLFLSPYQRQGWMVKGEEARLRLKPNTSCVGTSLWPATQTERGRERAKVSHFSPVWSIKQTLSSFLILNGITVPVSLGREEGRRRRREGGGVMHDLTKTEMERIFSCLKYFQKGIFIVYTTYHKFSDNVTVCSSPSLPLTDCKLLLNLSARQCGGISFNEWM